MTIEPKILDDLLLEFQHGYRASWDEVLRGKRFAKINPDKEVIRVHVNYLWAQGLVKVIERVSDKEQSYSTTYNPQHIIYLTGKGNSIVMNISKDGFTQREVEKIKDNKIKKYTFWTGLILGLIGLVISLLKK